MPGPVPNQFPTTDPGKFRLAFVGEAPGKTEVEQGRPFVGQAGAVLDKLLGHCGVSRGSVFVGNVCQHRPSETSNEFDLLDWSGEQVQGGIKQLFADLAVFRPNIVVCLGNAALHLFKRGNVPPPRGRKKYNWPEKIGDWRGSLWQIELFPFGMGDVTTPLHNRFKCIACYHPAAILRDWSLQALCKADLRRAAEEAREPELVIPERAIVIHQDLTVAVEILGIFRQKLLSQGHKLVSFDIEGGVNGVTCVSFAVSQSKSHVIPLCHNDGTPVWSEEDETAIWQALKELLEDEQVPKILTNALYDCFVLAWAYGITVRNVAHDTMLAMWEWQPELEKSLAMQTSLLTREPYYKQERLSEDDETAWTYNGKDSAVTFECHEQLQKILSQRSGSLSHYQFNVRLLPCLLYMELRGLPYDKKQAKREEEECWREIYAIQHRINVAAAAGRPELCAFLEGGGTLTGATSNTLTPRPGGSGMAVGEEYPQSMGCSKGVQQSGSVCIAAARAFGKAVAREKVKVEEVKLVPYRWNGKKWVKCKEALTHQSWPLVDELPAVYDFAFCKLRRVKKRLVSQPVSLDTWEKLGNHCKESCREKLRRVRALDGWIYRLLDDEPPSTHDEHTQRAYHAALGELTTLLGLSINIGSTSAGGDAQWFLYEHCKLPKVFAKEGNKKTTRLTTDDDAMLSIWARTQDERVLWCLRLRKKLKESTYLCTDTDQDGRIRMGLNVVGTKTGRLACYASPTEASNVQLQTISKGHRHLYIADPGCLLAQADLRGADSWTVAAWCAALGDPTMLDDLKAGMKIQSILVLLYNARDDAERIHINRLSREELKVLCKQVDEERWDYHASKRVLYGSSYGMRPEKMSVQLASDSYKKDGTPLFVSPATCQSIQERAFFVRYPGVRYWHRHWERKLVIGESVLAASFGHAHIFQGRKTEYKAGRVVANQDTLRELLATEPQLVTTYATKKAMECCWYDPENRREDGGLRVELLLTVHDSVIFQFKQEDKEWARRKIKQWFDNEVVIAGIPIKIPFSGTIGKDWGMEDAETL